jgi:dTMP kinase
VSDRTVYSSLAYQGYGRELPIEELRRINDWAIRSTWPDLVVLLDVSTKVIANRMRSRQLDRFERAGADFHARVAAGFAAMALADPDHWAVVDASRSVADVSTAIRSIVADRLGI